MVRRSRSLLTNWTQKGSLRPEYLRTCDSFGEDHDGITAVVISY